MSKGRKISPRQLRKLWAAYIEYRRPQVAPSTYARDYRAISFRLTRMCAELSYCRDAVAIRDWLLTAYSVDTTKRTLVQFSACCKWAARSGQLAADPFAGFAAELRAPRPDPNAYRAFSTEERDRIIAAIDRHDPFFSPWVRFLFWTGCRPEEAAALRWQHVNLDCSRLMIWEAEPADTRLLQRTKNYRSTDFPCNARLRLLLLSLLPAAPEPGLRVFRGRRSDYFNYIRFQTLHWRPVVMSLFDRGQLAFYGGQYHARHTWITMALQHLPIKDVAYLARVSPAVLLRHYADRSREIDIPEF
ncbi:MAG: site-specific integrase [Leptolyngbya sp. SIO4C1]|nr:site-specific integrase [Leptolyngbya sp. SIO4C1]